LRARRLGCLLGSAIAICAASAAAFAQDIQFGPRSDGPNSSSRTDGSYDREFVKEWQTNPPKGFPTLSKANVAATKAAVDHYTQIAEAGGFIPLPDIQLQPGETQPAVALLRRRLTASAELNEETSYPNFYSGEVEKAVMHFQASNGLAPTGILDKRTITALNVPAEVRLTQLKVNLERLIDLVKLVGKQRYVLVNIPAAQIEAIQGNTVVLRHAGVVGKPDRPTPQLRSTITDLNFNPMWTLPPTVIKEDLIPKGQDMQSKGQNVLEKFGIDAYEGGKKISSESIDWSSGKPLQLSYRQAPGKDNPLGFLKINFPSASSVYMHDSPKESLFGRNFRAASSGCVRVQNIEELAAWLLQGQPGWTKEQVDAMRENGQTKVVRLKKPVTLYFAYITAWATEDGVIQFRPDVYQKDGVGEIAAAY